MIDYLDQVDTASGAGLYYLALGAALTIPDVCAALAAPDGKSTGAGYAAWFEQNIAGLYGGHLTGDQCYAFRCAFLHQAATGGHPKGYVRVIFLEPATSSGMMHNNLMGDVLNIDVGIFCGQMTSAARTWMGARAGTEPYETNSQKLVRRHPNGIAPYIVGTPVIG